MRIRVLFSAAAACLALLVQPALAADVSAYGKLPSIEDVALSPDGGKLAIIKTDGEKRIILVIDTATNKPLGGLDGGTHKVRALQWFDNDNLIVTQSEAAPIDGVAGLVEYYTSSLFTVSANRQRQLLADRDSDTLHERPLALNVINDYPVIRTVEGKRVLFIDGVSFSYDQGVHTMFREDLKPVRVRMVRQGTADTDGFLVDPAGDVAVEVGQSVKGDGYLLLRKGGALKPVDLPPGLTDGPFIEGLSQDGKAAIFSYVKGLEQIYAELPLDGSAGWKTLDWSPDSDTLLFDPISQQLFGVRSEKDDLYKYTLLDPQLQATWKGIETLLKGQRLTLYSASDDHKRVVVLADSPRTGLTYYLIDLVSGRAQVIGDLYGLKSADISLTSPISYKAADGTVIPAYLTIPAKAMGNPKNLPLIVLPHGGPEYRTDAGFDWWAQALANEGYVVLQPNFRGSEGYGRAFTEKGYGEFGRKMQTDLSDGVRFLASQGLVDPKRVCIVGGSYGGYAALAGATLDRGVYRCAVSVAGMSDLKRMLLRNTSGRGEAFEYWTKFMGVEGSGDPKLAEISPINFADRIDVPVMLVHGKNDTVVRYEQSKWMAEAMTKAGKPVEFITLDDEDHWLSRSGTRQKMLQSVVAFLKKNNPPN